MIEHYMLLALYITSQQKKLEWILKSENTVFDAIASSDELISRIKNNKQLLKTFYKESK